VQTLLYLTTAGLVSGLPSGVPPELDSALGPDGGEPHARSASAQVSSANRDVRAMSILVLDVIQRANMGCLQVSVARSSSVFGECASDCSTRATTGSDAASVAVSVSATSLRAAWSKALRFTADGPASRAHPDASVRRSLLARKGSRGVVVAP
jgi:hypothetical protein